MANNVEIDESSRRMLDDAMEVIDASIDKIKMKLDNGFGWNSEDKMHAHTTVFNLFSVRGLERVRHYMLNSLYDKYEGALNQRIFEEVIPSLEYKYGELLLSEVVEQYFSKHEQYTKNLRIIFGHLEFVGCVLRRDTTRPLSLIEISKTCFCHLVWEKFHNEIEDALTDLIDSGAFSEENPVDDDDDQEELNKLKSKLTKFYNEMETLPDGQLQRTFDILREMKILS